MKLNKVLLFITLIGISSCCPKVDDCHCGIDKLGLTIRFNYNGVNSYLIAVDKETNLRLDSIHVSSDYPFNMTLTEDKFSDNTFSFLKDKLFIRDINTGKYDSLSSYSIDADTITSECNKCWLRKSKHVTCADIKSYELIFNTNSIYSNEITINP